MFWYLVIAFYVVNGLFAAGYGLSGRMRHVRIWLMLLFVAAPFAWALGVTFLLDYFRGLPSSDSREVRGTVFMRQRGKDAWGLEHDELTITVEGTNDLVKANLIGDSGKNIPDEVTFHYSGDPAREVRLREETNPLWAALFLLLTPLAGAVVLFFLDRRARPAPAVATIPSSG
jgi:hypothetical protein